METLRLRDREELALGPKGLTQESTSGALSLLLGFERGRETVGRGQTQHWVSDDA